MSAKLPELAAFSSVAMHLSFQKAANERGVSRSAMSHAVAGLERSLGVRLLNRDTRSVTLTDAGHALHERVRKAFGDIDDALEHLDHFRDSPVGKLRISALRSIGSPILGPVVAKLTRENPGLSIEVALEDRSVDLVAEGFDAGLRFSEQFHPEMIAVKLRQRFRFVVVGSPAYIAANPTVRVPDDLQEQTCIRHRSASGGETPWDFTKDGEAARIAVKGPIMLDSQDLMLEAALAGAGLAYVFESNAQPHLESGRLVRLLDEWRPSFSELYLYYPSRRQVSASLRALISALKEAH
jgi:DNA-binding transcriptional LysR family regulator